MTPLTFTAMLRRARQEIDCPQCDGRGWLMVPNHGAPWAEHREDCIACDGRGIQEIEVEETEDE